MRETDVNEVAACGHTAGTVGSQSLFFPQSPSVSIANVNQFPSSWYKEDENEPHVSRESLRKLS